MNYKKILKQLLVIVGFTGAFSQLLMACVGGTLGAACGGIDYGYSYAECPLGGECRIDLQETTGYAYSCQDDLDSGYNDEDNGQRACSYMYWYTYDDSNCTCNNTALPAPVTVNGTVPDCYPDSNSGLCPTAG